MAARTPRMATTPRAAARKATAAAQPRPRVTLDLDSLTKQKAFPNLKVPTAPFTFLLGGVQYELRDPRDSDWKLAIELAGNPFLLMRTALVGADDPIADPTDEERQACRERHNFISQEAARVAELVQDGKISREEPEREEPEPTLIDRFTAAYLPGWKLNALFDRWHEYFRIDLTAGKGILPTLLGTAE